MSPQEKATLFKQIRFWINHHAFKDKNPDGLILKAFQEFGAQGAYEFCGIIHELLIAFNNQDSLDIWKEQCQRFFSSEEIEISYPK